MGSHHNTATLRRGSLQDPKSQRKEGKKKLSSERNPPPGANRPKKEGALRHLANVVQTLLVWDEHCLGVNLGMYNFGMCSI